MKALDLPYELYLERNGGVETCGICKAAPKKRRLDRDHDHKTGKPRALLCVRCNKALASWMTPTWLRRAANYLEDHALR